MQNTASQLLVPVKQKTASGAVQIISVPHWGFAANDPNVHQGCSGCSYDVASDRLFMSEDPLGYRDGFNLYQYAHNNPLKYNDPMGTTARPTSFALPAYTPPTPTPRTTPSPVINTIYITRGQPQETAPPASSGFRAPPTNHTRNDYGGSSSYTPPSYNPPSSGSSGGSSDNGSPSTAGSSTTTPYIPPSAPASTPTPSPAPTPSDGGNSSGLSGGDGFADGAQTAAIAQLVSEESSREKANQKSIWEIIQEGGSAKIGPGAGYHIKDLKILKFKAGGGVVFAAGGVGADSNGLTVWGKSTADFQLSYGRYGGRAYLWDVDFGSYGVNNIDTFGVSKPSWDWSIGIGGTITPYSFEVEYDFQPIIDYFKGRR